MIDCFNPRTVSTAVRTLAGGRMARWCCSFNPRTVSTAVRTSPDVTHHELTTCFNPRTVSTAVRTVRRRRGPAPYLRVSILARSQRPCAHHPQHAPDRSPDRFQSSHGLNGRAHLRCNGGWRYTATFQSSHGLNGRAHPRTSWRRSRSPRCFNPRTVSTAVRTTWGCPGCKVFLMFQSSHGLNGRAHTLPLPEVQRAYSVSILARSQRPCARFSLSQYWLFNVFQSSHGLNGRAHDGIRRADEASGRFNPRTVSTAVRTIFTAGSTGQPGSFQSSHGLNGRAHQNTGLVLGLPLTVSILARSQRPCAPAWCRPAPRRVRKFQSSHGLNGRAHTAPARPAERSRPSFNPRTVSTAVRHGAGRRSLPSARAFQSSHGLNGRAHAVHRPDGEQPRRVSILARSQRPCARLRHGCERVPERVSILARSQRPCAPGERGAAPFQRSFQSSHGLNGRANPGQAAEDLCVRQVSILARSQRPCAPRTNAGTWQSEEAFQSSHGLNGRAHQEDVPRLRPARNVSILARSQRPCARGPRSTSYRPTCFNPRTVSTAVRTGPILSHPSIPGSGFNPRTVSTAVRTPDLAGVCLQLNVSILARSQRPCARSKFHVSKIEEKFQSSHGLNGRAHPLPTP